MELAAWRITSSGLLGRLFGRGCAGDDDDDENAETREQHASVVNAPAISNRFRVKQRCIFVVQ